MLQPTWHERPRVEASLGNARGLNPVCVGIRREEEHKMAPTPETSRRDGSGSPHPTVVDTALS